MNCAAALEAMLDAEPQELEGLGTATLAMHLASCGRCRRVADQVLEETRLLAAALTGVPSPARARRTVRVPLRQALIPAGLVAAALLAVVWRRPDAPVTARVSAVPTPPAAAVRDTAAPTPVTRDTRPVAVQRSAPALGRAFPAPKSLAAFRIQVTPEPLRPTRSASPSGGAGGAVSVDAPNDYRVAVIRTANPKFTVVWLY